MLPASAVDKGAYVSVDERPFYACLFPPACLLFEPLLALSLIAKRLSALAHRLDDLCECDIHELVAAALWQPEPHGASVREQQRARLREARADRCGRLGPRARSLADERDERPAQLAERLL